MKPKLLLQTVCMLLLSLSFHFSFAFSGGSVMGRIIDPITGAPAAGVTVVLENQGNQVSVTTNDNGYYYASNLPVGMYSITAVFMSNHSTVNGVKLAGDEQKIVDIELIAAVEKDSVIITTYRNPLIDPIIIDQVKLDRADFIHEPITSIEGITATQPGVTEVNGVFYVKGAREGSLTYYIDGAPIMAKADIPLCGLETYTIYTGFIPPKYGDSVGGVVVMETRNFFAENH